MSSVGVRELRQNLSRYLDLVKEGESLDVTEHGRLVARLSPAGPGLARQNAELAARFGATLPSERLQDVAAQVPRRSAPAGTADAVLGESRTDRA